MSFDDKVSIRSKRARQPTNFYGYGVNYSSVKKREVFDERLILGWKTPDNDLENKEKKKKIRKIEKVLKANSKTEERNNPTIVRPKRARKPTNFFAYSSNVQNITNQNDGLENNISKKKVGKINKEKTNLKKEKNTHGDYDEDIFLDESKPRSQKPNRNKKQKSKLSITTNGMSGNIKSQIDRSSKPEADSLISCCIKTSFRTNQYSEKIEHDNIEAKAKPLVESSPKHCILQHTKMTKKSQNSKRKKFNIKDEKTIKIYSPSRLMNQDCCLLQTILNVNKTVKNLKVRKKSMNAMITIKAKPKKKRQPSQVIRSKNVWIRDNFCNSNKKSADMKESKSTKHGKYSEIKKNENVRDEHIYKSSKKCSEVQDSLSSLHQSKPWKVVKKQKVKAHVLDENKRHGLATCSMDSLQAEITFKGIKNDTNISMGFVSSPTNTKKNNLNGNYPMIQSAIAPAKNSKHRVNSCGSKCFDITFADSHFQDMNDANEETINYGGKSESSHPESIKEICGTKCSDISYSVSEILYANYTVDCQTPFIGSLSLQIDSKEADRQKMMSYSVEKKRQKDPSILLEHQSTLNNAIKTNHKNNGSIFSTKNNLHRVNIQKKECTNKNLQKNDKNSTSRRKNHPKQLQAPVQSVNPLHTVKNKKKQPMTDNHKKHANSEHNLLVDNFVNTDTDRCPLRSKGFQFTPLSLKQNTKSLEKSKTELVQCQSLILPSDKRKPRSNQPKKNFNQLRTHFGLDGHLDLESTKNFFHVHDDKGMSSSLQSEINITAKDHINLLSRKEDQETMEGFLVHFRQTQMLSSKKSHKLIHHEDDVQYDSSSSSSDISLFSRQHL